jgi:translation initiation factor 1
MSNSRLVYSTDDGDRRERRPPGRTGPQVPRDGVVRVFREQGGRRGKTVTVVRGLSGGDLDAVAGELKRLCGSGGTVKDGRSSSRETTATASPGICRRRASASSWRAGR